jgi:hypothetical protein
MSDRQARRGPMADGLTGSRAAAVWAVVALDLLVLLVTLIGVPDGNDLYMPRWAVGIQPLRIRVQRAVDRRFNRSRYDAERLVAAFSGRLRDEVDMTALLGELDTTVRRAIAPIHVGIWLRESQDGPR